MDDNRLAEVAKTGKLNTSKMLMRELNIHLTGEQVRRIKYGTWAYEKMKKMRRFSPSVRALRMHH